MYNVDMQIEMGNVFTDASVLIFFIYNAIFVGEVDGALMHIFFSKCR